MTLPNLKALPLASTAWILFLLTCTLLAVIIAIVTLRTREDLRNDLLARDAQTISLLAEMEMEHVLLDFPEWTGPAFQEFALSEVLVNTSRYEGVIGVALYTPDGILVESIPWEFPIKEPSPHVITTALLDTPASIYWPNGQLSDFLETGPSGQSPSDQPGTESPLLAVAIPLAREASTVPEGVGFYLLDGSRVEAAFTSLDRELANQAAGAFGGGTLLLGVIVWLAFRHLDSTQKRLAQRSEALAQANRELSLALKSNALGSLSAQLMHNLKSPLASLQGYVEELRIQSVDEGAREMAEEAYATLQRMLNHIQEVMSTLQDAGLDDDSLELSWAEFCQVLKARLEEARLQDLNLQISAPPEGRLDGNRANILLLILFNLIHNAWEASDPGSPIVLDFARDTNGTRARVRDCGPGLSPTALAKLFQPQRSTKPGGSGLGLALSHQLAQRIGAILELSSSSAEGSCFTVSISNATTTRAESPSLTTSA